MKWAVEIKATSLQRRNLADLLAVLGFQTIELATGLAFASPLLDSKSDPAEVWSEAKRLRTAMTGPAEIDPEFILGAVVECSSSELRRHCFLEARPGRLNLTGGTAELTVLPPSDLSEAALANWKAEHLEQEYQSKLELQLSKLEPVFRSDEAAKVLDLLRREKQTGETLFKIYELVEGNPSKRKAFQSEYGISKSEFDRFSDAVHNPVVSGDLARHAYRKPPKTSNPMTLDEARAFVERLVTDWLAALRIGSVK